MKFFRPVIMMTVLTAAVVSCKKENVDNPAQTPAPVSNIEAVIKFNGNLSDSTGKTSTGVMTGSTSYVSDRNGNPNSALYLDGSSRLTFAGLNLKGKSLTISAWIKYANTGGGLQFLITAFQGSSGPSLYQVSDKLGCSISTPGTNSAEGNSVDAGWHHLAATFDGADVKVYIDGTFAATASNPGSIGDGSRDMIVGFFNGNYWKGNIDDIRVYSTVMSAADIQKLTTL